MWYSIDYPGVKEFKDLYLNNFPHRIVQPTLRFPRRCARWVYWDAMSAEGRTDSLEILEREAKDRSMLSLQHIWASATNTS
jgi:hypothetical protein